MDEHVHQWIWEDGVMVCAVCGATRIPDPGEAEMMVTQELRIRHDGEESDL